MLPTNPSLRSRDARVAVIDVGSNSGRVTVFRLEGAAHLAVLADARTALKLVRDVRKRGRLSDKSVRRTVEALRGFKAIARGLGTQEMVAVATSAVREAENGGLLLAAILAQTGINVETIDGGREAALGLAGAIHALPVTDGAMLDIGGGSLQIARFQDRTLAQAWSFPLGALRLSDAYLHADPPTAGEQTRLRRHVADTLKAAGVGPLAPHEALVGTGGTVRNLAKIDRQARSSAYPIPRLHGYPLQRARIAEAVERLAALPQAARARVPGLNDDRADSIVGGALAALTCMEVLGADELLVSGHGLREGLAVERLALHQQPVEDVQRDALAAVAERFATWDRVTAERRMAVAARLWEAFAPGTPVVERRIAEWACFWLDVGASVDYYSRRGHAAHLAVATDLAGFSHRDVALLAACLSLHEDESALHAFEPALQATDLPTIQRTGAVMALADGLCSVMPPSVSADALQIIPAGGSADELALLGPGLDPWPLQAAARRAERAFGVRLAIGAGDA